MTNAPRGVLLDVDGTLLDSNDAHARAWVASLAEAGFDVPFDRVRRLIGEGGDKVLPEVTGLDPDSARGEAIAKRRRAIFKERELPGCRPFPRARDLVARMRRDGLAIVVATSAAEEELDDLLRAANVHDLIERATTSSDAERSKPDPDIVAAAVKRSKRAPEELVMLGDTPYDVIAAKRAGVAAIALRSGGWADAELEGAIAIYDDAADLLARYGESPLARGLAIARASARP